MPTRIALGVTTLALGIVVALYGVGVLGPTGNLSYGLYDARFRARGSRPAPEDVVIVTVDDRSLDLLAAERGVPTRRQFASLIRALGNTPAEGAEAGAIVFDYWFTELTLPDSDAGSIFTKLRDLYSAEAARQGAEPLPTDASLFVHLGILPAEVLDAVRADAASDPDGAAFAAALDARAAGVAARMRVIEQAGGFPDGLSRNYRRLFFATTCDALESDLQLAFDIRDSRSPVVLARFISPEGDRVPDPILAAVASMEGLINATKDRDGAMRSVPTGGQFKPDPGSGGASGQLIPPLSIAGLAVWEGLADIAPGGATPHVGPHPLPRDGRLHIWFHGPPRTFRHVPLHAVIPEHLVPSRVAEDDARVARGELPPRPPPLASGALGKALVLVGDMTQTGQDFVATPFSGHRVDARGSEERAALDEMAGVEVHANAVETLRRHRALHLTHPLTMGGALLLLAGLGLAFYVPALGFRGAVLLFVLFMCGILALDYALFVSAQVVLDTVPLLTFTLLQFISGVTAQGILQQRKRAQVTQLFGRYLSPKVVQRMVEGEMAVEMEGQTRHLTTLFSDIRGFTKIAESLTAAEVAGVLQDYFERMIGVVFGHDGTLDKLMGDAVMAFFGAPEEQPDHAVRGAETALDMIAALERLKREDPRPVMQEFDIGIGINTGDVTVGNLGSQKFVNYTVLGDAVNLASRLEGQNKEYGTHIIAGEATARELGDRFVLRELDWVKVKGKSKPATIFEVVGRPADVGAPKRAAMARFAEGLALWRTGAFAAADAKFVEGLAADPADAPCAAFKKRCAEYRADPPKGAWDGVYVARTK